MVGVIAAAQPADRDAIVALARDFSPRIDICGPREVALDLSGLDRLFGDVRTLGAELRRVAADRGLRVRIAIAGTCTAARLLVHHRAGLTIADPGTEPHVLAPLPIGLLQVITADITENRSWLITTRRWGLKTLGELAALPASELTSRVGQEGALLQRLARGEDPRPLVPAIPDERFEQALDLEWPIEGLEPVSFVLGRLMEPLALQLERRDRGAAVLRVHLHLVTRAVHERAIELPATMRDARTLRTLALLDLESHPPSAAIDRVVVAVDPAPSRVVQFSLLTRPIPEPEQLSTLLARLQVVMGEGRCGSPVLPDSWAPGAFGLAPFAPGDKALFAPGDKAPPDDRGCPPREVPSTPVVALRRFRYSVPARIRMDGEGPVHVLTDRRSVSGGTVITRAGPWRTSGGWWNEPASRPHQHPATDHQPPVTGNPRPNWDRDEWDVTLQGGISYRLFRERDHDAWFIDAVID